MDDRTDWTSLRCRHGCASPVVGIYHFPAGCICFTDPVQALCSRHVDRGMDNNVMETIVERDTTRDEMDRLTAENGRLRVEVEDAKADALRLHQEKMRYFDALLEMRCRDDRNGSLHENYRKIIDAALSDEQQRNSAKD